MNNPEEAVIGRGRPIATAQDLAAALTDRFVTNADAGDDAANDALIEELIAWRHRRAPESVEGFHDETVLPRREPGSHEMPTPASIATHEAAEPSLELLRRVREGLIHLPQTESQSNEPTASASMVVVEFPSLDLDELEDVPLRRAVYLDAVEEPGLPGILAARLPGVVHARKEHGQERQVHEFIDSTTGSAVRYVLSVDPYGDIEALVAESGAPGLFDRIVAACTNWQRPTT